MERFFENVGGKIGDLVGDSVPVVAEMIDAYQNIKDIAEIVNEFEKNETDYTEIDKRLFEIETHIRIMNISEHFFIQSIELLEETKEDNN